MRVKRRELEGGRFLWFAQRGRGRCMFWFLSHFGRDYLLLFCSLSFSLPSFTLTFITLLAHQVDSLVLFLLVVLRYIQHHHVSYCSSLYLFFLLISLLQPCFLLLISTTIISLTFPLNQGLASYLISWFSGFSFFLFFVRFGRL